MKNQNMIAVIVLVSFLISAPATGGGVPLAAETIADQIQRTLPFKLNRQSIIVSENKPQAPEGAGQSTDENKDQTPDSGTADKENSSNNSNDAEAKPLKAFKPSEEIAADQAVDFPVDI